MSHFHGEINERVRKIEHRITEMQESQSRIAMALAMYLFAAQWAWGGVDRKDVVKSVRALGIEVDEAA